MKVKLILPALTEAVSPYWRPIKYSLFPPLGLATLAGYLGVDDEVTLQDEHVEKLDVNDEPDLVVIQVYITSAYRAIALGAHGVELPNVLASLFAFVPTFVGTYAGVLMQRVSRAHNVLTFQR